MFRKMAASGNSVGKMLFFSSVDSAELLEIKVSRGGIGSGKFLASRRLPVFFVFRDAGILAPGDGRFFRWPVSSYKKTARHGPAALTPFRPR